MRHVGDITKLSGWTLPIVDCIIGGSPCQDLSVAGARKGLQGERSGLFMEQVRIVKEMRERDGVENGRAGFLRRPRFLGWENVPGAFSSNGGKDFQAVLTEIVRIAEPDAPDVPLPEGGRWPKAGCLYDDMGRWSVAWSVHDAQFWGTAQFADGRMLTPGTPQRRRRIALVADLGGLAAAEIQFERKGLSWHPQPGEEARQETAGYTGGGSDCSVSGGVMSFQERAGGPGGGKGILIQDEHVGALSTLNIQKVLAYPDVANTLTERYDGSPSPDKKQGGNVVCYAVTTRAHSAEEAPTIEPTDTAPTLNAFDSGETRATVYAVCESQEEAQAKCYGISPDSSNAMKSSNPHSGVYEADTARTLDNNGWSPNCNQGGMAIVQPICIEMTSTKNTVVDDGVSPTLTARMGTGGNQVNAVLADAYQHYGYRMSETVGPLTKDQQTKIRGDMPLVIENEESLEAVCIGNGQTDGISCKQVANTLDTMHDQQAVLVATGETVAPALVASAYKGPGNTQDGLCVMAPDVAHALKGKANCQYREDSETYICAAVDCRNGAENADVNGTLQSKDQGQNLNGNNVVRQNMVVRRLTPMECERLQGYPDGWTDIGEWTDSKGKKRQTTDSARYKALGNSICLPYWFRFCRRISAQYDRPATLGSLFDGIGGFPLCWERCNGTGTAIWASEIEEFCIAVTQRRFPEG